MTEQEALKQLKQAEALRDKAREIVENVVENAPYGKYKNVWYLMFTEYESAEESLKHSHIYG